LILAALSGGNILLVFFHQYYILAVLGPGSSTDALFAGMVIPELFLAVLTGSLSNVLVPILAVEDGEEFSTDAWSFFQGIGLLIGVISLVLWILAPVWVPLTVPGFDSSTVNLTISMTRILLISMPFIAFNSVLWSIYHARLKFIFAELSPLLSSAGGLAFLLWGLPRFGVAVAAWAMVLRGAIQTVVLAPGLGLYRRPSWKTQGSRKAWERIYPLLLGTSYYKTDQLVDRFLASMAPAGQLSLLYFAQQIYRAVNQIISKAIAAPMVPLLAKYSSNGNWDLFRKTSHRRLAYVFGLTIIGYLSLALFGDPILRILFGHGRFGDKDIVYLQWLLMGLGGVLVGGGLGQILSTSFYAKSDTRTPTKIGVTGFTLGLGLKVLGFWSLGVWGIALGTTVYYLFNSVLLKFSLEKHLRKEIEIV